MKILICVSHDNEVDKAKTALNDHDVTVVTSAHHALSQITSIRKNGQTVRGEYDAVFTAFSIKEYADDTKLCPLGPLVALEAVTQDRPIVGILSPNHSAEQEGCGVFFKLGIWNSIYRLHNSLIFSGGNIEKYCWDQVLKNMIATKAGSAQRENLGGFQVIGID